jgi:hypothetical protein
MGSLVAFDPGTYSGFAWFIGRTLQSCSLIESPWRYSGIELDHFLDASPDCVCEFPFLYPGGRGKGDGNDLLKVARIAGLLTAPFSEDRVRLIYPRTWKGNVPKELMLDRILTRLSEEEKARIPRLPKGKLHNVIDAIGIGLHHLGRL